MSETKLPWPRAYIDHHVDENDAYIDWTPYLDANRIAIAVPPDHASAMVECLVESWKVLYSHTEFIEDECTDEGVESYKKFTSKVESLLFEIGVWKKLFSPAED